MPKKSTAVILAIVIAILAQPCISSAESNYEVYVFGINLKAFRNCNWIEVTAGAVSSLLVHELGHALYLETQGEDWDLSVSSSGLAVHTNARLSDSQYRNFGRAGFLLQAGIGALLTSFEGTRHSDFTKGWVSMNAAQIWTYDLRDHDNTNDFDLIEKGGGDTRLEFNMMAFVIQNNLVAAVTPGPVLFNLDVRAKETPVLRTWDIDTTFSLDQTGSFGLTPPDKMFKPIFSLQQSDPIDFPESEQPDHIPPKPTIRNLALAEPAAIR